MEELTDLPPIAKLVFLGQESGEPGWYLHQLINGESSCRRLDIEIGADAFGAVKVAAELLGCGPERIQVGGVAWPRPLHGLIPA